MQRREFIIAGLAGLTFANGANAQASGFNNWITGFKTRASAAGISNQTLNAAFAGVQYLPDSISRDRNQAEFVKPLGDYMSTAVSDTRIETGRAMVAQYADLLSRIEATYGVPAHIVTAIWGMESNYGQHRGDVPLVSTLATLAFDGRRGAFFEEQLVAALGILQRGDVTPANMTGSWAGAMGHTQFIPTSYQAYAVDFTGDGRRDIWADDPSDALASTAAYLSRFKWQSDQPWGVEVLLPNDFDFSQTSSRSPAAWGDQGIRGVDGQVVQNYGDADLIFPTGADGPAFLTFSNYRVISRYNNAQAYILGVGHLGDRISGKGPLQASWPQNQRGLKRAERVELQQRLTDAGFSTGGVDGRIGPNSQAAIRAYQRNQGLPADGYASATLLERLR